MNDSIIVTDVYSDFVKIQSNRNAKGILEFKGSKAKKAFPWFWVILAAAACLILLFVFKKK